MYSPYAPGGRAATLSPVNAVSSGSSGYGTSPGGYRSPPLPGIHPQQQRHQQQPQSNMRYQSMPSPYSPMSYPSTGGQSSSPRNGGGGGGSGIPVQATHPRQPLPPKKGTLNPGERVKIGPHTVIIEKYLSEGGYAHVYLTYSDTPIPGRQSSYRQQCLKRLAVRDDQGSAVLKEVEHEIEIMKAVQGNPWVVEYLASSVRRMEATSSSSQGRQAAGWEIFILMEFCAGGGIIDLLNRRLQNRLREDEILSIFVDVCEAVAFMHSRSPALLHRDLKIENILCHPISSAQMGSSDISAYRYKLCDFGSTTIPSDRPPRSKQEVDEQQMDLGRHTTLQYRSPEMVEPLLGLPVGLPADVWALGVLLYKLCYYTTPFEAHGPLAIVNAKYTFPAYPVYSPHLQQVIASMLMEQPSKRPTVFDVLKLTHRMRGTTPSREYSAPPPQNTFPQKVPELQHKNRLDFTDGSKSNLEELQSRLRVPEIQPQRRGRPSRADVEQKENEPVARSSRPRDLSLQSTGGGSSPNPPLPNHVREQITQGIQDFKNDIAQSFSPPPSVSRKTATDLLDSLDEDAFGAKPLQAPREQSTPLSPSSGFGDSFGDAFPTRPQGKLPSARKETTRSKDPADDSFESRFPSIEALIAADSKSSSSERPLIAARLASYHQPSATGDGLSPTGVRDSSADKAADGHLLPRSTHVTGSAFKAFESNERKSPAPEATALKDASEVLTAKEDAATGYRDLLTGDDDPGMMGEATAPPPSQSAPKASGASPVAEVPKPRRPLSVAIPPKPAALSVKSPSTATPSEAPRSAKSPLISIQSPSEGAPVKPAKPQRLASGSGTSPLAAPPQPQRQASTSSDDTDLPDFVDSPIRPSPSRRWTEDKGVATDDILRKGAKSPALAAASVEGTTPSEAQAQADEKPSSTQSPIEEKKAKPVVGSKPVAASKPVVAPKPVIASKPAVAPKPKPEATIQDESSTDKAERRSSTFGPSLLKRNNSLRDTPQPSSGVSRSTDSPSPSDKPKSVRSLIGQWNQATAAPSKNAPAVPDKVPLGMRRRL